MKTIARKEPHRTRILFVITRLAVGGAPQNLLTTIRGLDRSRYRICLVTGVPGAEEGSLIDAARELDVELHVLPSLQREIHPLRDPVAFWRLYRLIRRGRYHIVHTHLSKAGILGRLAARCAGVPGIVHTYHGDVFEDYFGPFKSRVLLGAERLVGHVTGRFAVVSEALRRRFRSYRVGQNGAFCVVPNGVWTDSFPAPPADVRKGHRVGTVAMFYPIKRVDLFLEAARCVLRRRPDTEFVVVGGGIEEAALRQAARDLGDRVRFLGIRSDVSELLCTFDVFVLSSDFEGAGIGLIEAMLSGLPVVATRVGGVPEIVAEGTTGLLVPPGDVGAMTAGVLRLLKDPDLRREMGAAARERVLRQFSAEEMVRRLDGLYGELNAGGRG